MILSETKKIVNVFIQAIPALRTKAFDAQSPAVVDGYEHILKEISSHLERALDGTSTEAAKKQCELLKQLERFAQKAEFDISFQDSTSDLLCAKDIATVWAALPPAKKGLARIFAKAPKEAKAQDYLTYEGFTKKSSFHYICSAARYHEMLGKFNALKEHLAKGEANFEKKRQESFALYEHLEKERDALQKKRDELSAQREQAPAGTESADSLVVDILDIEMMLFDAERTMDDLAHHISEYESNTFAKITSLFELLSSQTENMMVFVALMSDIDFDMLHKVIDGCATFEEVERTFNIIDSIEAVNTVQMRELESIREEILEQRKRTH